MIAVSIGDFIGKSLKVTPDGVLTAMDSKLDADSILLTDVASGLRSQFDSDLGEDQLSIQDCISMITENDVFHFLVPSDDNIDGGEYSDGGSRGYSFRHISITNMIYDLLPFSRRIELHGKVAVALEARMQRSTNTTALLPTLAYHYGRSDAIVKRVDVFEELGKLYVDRAQYFESCNILSSLIDYVRDNEELMVSTLSSDVATRILDVIRRAYWTSMVSYGFLKLKDVASAKKAMIEALGLSGS
ncbi:hypothetical protein HDU96_008578 [Phlyctochytrium bullatum]|nr:hypothetical protein HDU96_008578 [Phlyctochytrium bullatum]